MIWTEKLTERNEGCSAILKDRGEAKPVIPTCMGAIGIEGAFSSIVGCNNIEVCREKMIPINGKVRVLSHDSEGVVNSETTVNRGGSLRASSAAIPPVPSHRMISAEQDQLRQLWSKEA